MVCRGRSGATGAAVDRGENGLRPVRRRCGSAWPIFRRRLSGIGPMRRVGLLFRGFTGWTTDDKSVRDGIQEGSPCRQRVDRWQVPPSHRAATLPGGPGPELPAPIITELTCLPLMFPANSPKTDSQEFRNSMRIGGRGLTGIRGKIQPGPPAGGGLAHGGDPAINTLPAGAGSLDRGPIQ